MRRRLRSVWRAKETQLCGVKRSWEIIADNLSKAGWSWGCVSAKRFSRSNRLPFVIRTGPRRESAVWPRRRGSGEGEPRSGCSRCQRESLYRAMLLNEFLKEHRKGEQLEKQVAALTAALQKVSAQLEANGSASQTVVDY